MATGTALARGAAGAPLWPTLRSELQCFAKSLDVNSFRGGIVILLAGILPAPVKVQFQAGV